MHPTTLLDCQRRLRSGEITAHELAEAAFVRMEALDGQLKATVRRPLEAALSAAAEADRRRAEGDAGVLLGIPVVIKDNLAWKGHRLTHGSRISEGYVAPYDATVVARLKAAGAVIVAQAAMDEFAMGSSGEFCAAGPTSNPWDPSRVPGGSSSGSAVAVAAGFAPLALGSDTGGSVRLPAAFCGVTGFRPSYGVLSRYGLSAMASSLDQVGPITRDVADLMAALPVLAGVDPLDSTSLDLPGVERLREPRPASLKGLRVGIPEVALMEGLEPGVRTCLEDAFLRLEGEGAILVPVALPDGDRAVDTYYLLNTSEVSSNLSRFDGVRFGHRAEAEDLQGLMARTRAAGFGPEVKRRILLGAFCLSRGHYEAFYVRALKVREWIRRQFLAAFSQVDVLAMPVSPCVAFPQGSRMTDPLSMYLADLFTVTASLADLPCLSVPAGFSAGLPVGLQFVGPRLGDVTLLETALAFQAVTAFHLEAPQL